MGNEDNTGILGKKIFFLYPSAVIQNQIMEELVQQEFEVYIIKDEAKLRRIIKQFPDSIILANINEGMQEKEWDPWIRRIMKDPANVKVGVLTANDDEALKKKYTGEIKVPCGYTVIKSDINLAIKQIIDQLKLADAKGRRKYIRATMENETAATVNMPFNGTFINGVIKDISVVGFSCAFTDDPALAKNSLFQGIQLRLQTMLLKAEGIAFGSRMDGEMKIYVIIFTQRTDPEVKIRIRKYIQTNLQAKMDLLTR